MLNRDEDILQAAEDWQKAGHGVALATVVETWGSAPRPAGSSLVINDDGTFLGSVSGGCVEGAVVTEALDVIASGKPKMLEFGVADETAARRPVILVTDTESGEQRLVKAADFAADPLRVELSKQLRMGKSGTVE